MNEFRIVYAKPGRGRVFKDGVEIVGISTVSVRTEAQESVHRVTLEFVSTQVTIEHDQKCVDEVSV